LGLYSLLFPSPVRQRKTNRQQFNSKTILPLRTITLLLLLLTTTSFWSQENLVLNPSFEDTASMTYGYPFVVTANWWSANGSDADYFSPFEQELPSGSGAIYAVPISQIASEQAQDGLAYCGLVVYESTGETKEYLQGFLAETMLPGHEYCVSICISLADSSSLRSCDFQVAFSDENVNDGNAPGVLDLQHWVDFDISDVDTSGWTYYEHSYIAFGGESFVYLGSNTPSEELNCVEQYNSTILWNTSYLLVDNLSVTESSLCTSGLNEQMNTVLVVYPNSSTNELQLSQSHSKHLDWELFDISGSLVSSGVLQPDDSKIEVGYLSNGLYVLDVGNHESIKFSWVK
jgi:hypothetical protein